MNAIATTGTIQPVVRRVASSSRTMKTTPRMMSSLVAGEARDHIPPADAIAEASRQREQQEAQDQHEGDMRVAQRLRRDDGELISDEGDFAKRPRDVAKRPGSGHRGVKVEQRH